MDFSVFIPSDPGELHSVTQLQLRGNLLYKDEADDEMMKNTE